jgi:hypothetical protein
VANGHCHNCDAAVSGNFCASCGQETVLHVASAREFLHEFIGHYVALEGKLWKTLALLLFRPGRLTAEYIGGRRARYVQPLRIYLTFSILFFALLRYSAHDVNLGASHGAQPPAASSAAVAVDADASRFKTDIGQLDPAWEQRMRQIWDLPESEKASLFQSAVFSYVPYAVFGMMPLFALYLKLLYLGSGRRYGEHLLFALHANAFAFVMFGLLLVTPWNWLVTACFLWLVLYLPVAMRRVYGGGWWGTGARWVVLMAVHLLSMVAAILGTIFVVLVA